MSHTGLFVFLFIHVSHLTANSAPALFTSASGHSQALRSSDLSSPGSSVSLISNDAFSTGKGEQGTERGDYGLPSQVFLDEYERQNEEPSNGISEPEQTQDEDVLYTLGCDGEMCMSEDEQQLICQIPPELTDDGQNALGNDGNNQNEGVLTIMDTPPSFSFGSVRNNNTVFCMEVGSETSDTANSGDDEAGDSIEMTPSPTAGPNLGNVPSTGGFPSPSPGFPSLFPGTVGDSGTSFVPVAGGDNEDNGILIGGIAASGGGATATATGSGGVGGSGGDGTAGGVTVIGGFGGDGGDGTDGGVTVIGGLGGFGGSGMGGGNGAFGVGGAIGSGGALNAAEENC
ncbi:PE-PGRS family protein [Gracilaria domingensis]|nr:PE-PGRS family protein [Gracilaria domingensis]